MRDVEIVSRLNKLAKPINTQADLLQKYGHAIEGMAAILQDQRELMRITVARVAFIFQKLQLNEEEYAEYEKEIRAKFEAGQKDPESGGLQSSGTRADEGNQPVGDAGVLRDEGDRVHSGVKGVSDSGESCDGGTPANNGNAVPDSCEIKG